LQAGGHRFDPDWLHQLSPRLFGFARVMSSALRHGSASLIARALRRLLFKNLEMWKRNAFMRLYFFESYSCYVSHSRKISKVVNGPRLIGVIWSSD
jgi:hypothetical protein